MISLKRRRKRGDVARQLRADKLRIRRRSARHQSARPAAKSIVTMKSHAPQSHAAQ
jgi:hypothetical protein